MSHTDQADCIFCKIISRAMPAVVLFENDEIIAFMDAFPSSRGHALVVPRVHRRDLHEMQPEELQNVTLHVQRLARAQKQALQPDGIVVSQFNGAAAGQTVFHYHVHVAPRWEGESRNVHGRDLASRDELETIAARIREALD